MNLRALSKGAVEEKVEGPVARSPKLGNFEKRPSLCHFPKFLGKWHMQDRFG